MTTPQSLTEASQSFINNHYLFSDFTVIIQLLGGIFLVASFLDYTNKFVDTKIINLKKNLQKVISNFRMKYAGSLSSELSDNRKINKLHSRFLNKTAKIQNIQDNVSKNIIGELATKFLDKYLYLGIYCVFILLFSSLDANSDQSVHPYRFKLCSFTDLKCAGIFHH